MTNTYQIISKYDGFCRECGKPIKRGTKVNWTPGEGIRHASKCETRQVIEARQVEREATAQTIGRVNIMELAQ